MKYKIGDRVRIVSKKVGDKWNLDGLMDKWLGKEMTIRFVGSDYYFMKEDNLDYPRSWTWYEHMIEGLAEESESDSMSSNGKLNKGIENKLVQDMYRAVTQEDGKVQFNPVKMINICFVKHDGNDKVCAFENKSDKRLKKDTRVQVKTANGVTDATVVSSIKIQRKYLKSLMLALCGVSINQLQPVLGVYEEKTVVKKEFIKIAQ